MSGTDWSRSRQSYLDRLAPPDVRAGARIVEQLVAAGSSIGRVVEEVLRPAQIEVGRRWQLNRWTVADEHAASAVTEAALMAAAAAAPPRTAASLGSVVFACAAGEWHTLPLRMVSEVVAEAGDILLSWADRRPIALAVSRRDLGEPPTGEQELFTVRQQVLAAVGRDFPASFAGGAWPWQGMEQDIDDVVRFSVMAVRYDDTSILSEFAVWLGEVLAVRGVPPAVLETTLLAVADALEEGRPRVSAGARRVVTMMGSPTSGAPAPS